MCPECNAKDRQQNEQKLQTLLPKFNSEAKAQNLASFAAIQTVNSNPGWRWVAIGDEGIERANRDNRAVMYYSVD